MWVNFRLKLVGWMAYQFSMPTSRPLSLRNLSTVMALFVSCAKAAASGLARNAGRERLRVAPSKLPSTSSMRPGARLRCARSMAATMPPTAASKLWAS